jgi:S1-C subfamily serine protease
MSEPSRELTAIHARLVRDKLRFRSALQSLSAATRTKVDVRRHIAERPLPWLLAALALGFGLGARR